MKQTRRNFLNTTGLLGATALATGGLPASALAADKPRALRIQLGICTYCYWHLDGPKFPIETVMDKAAALGVAGVDMLHRQMELPEREPLTAEHRAYLHRLKRHAFHSGVAPVCLSTHQTFLSPDAAGRHRQCRAHEKVHRDLLRTGHSLHAHQHRTLEHD